MLPSGYVKIAIEHVPFIVDLPIHNGDVPSFFVGLPGRVCHVPHPVTSPPKKCHIPIPNPEC